ncbi:MAG: adenylate/guanylate cyclase domain-containing protein [Bacteroidia bacterium]|nr:adenylate/guanylate cyclase domain-containing protein [Bacteroidia bacterium]
MVWIGAALMFSFIRLYGVEEEAVFELHISYRNVLMRILLQGLFTGTAFGLAFGLLDILLDKKILRETAYGLVILIRTLAHIILTLVIILHSILITHLLFDGGLDETFVELLRESMLSKTAIVLLVYTGVVSILFNLIRQINAMFGPGILYNIISGKYHHPKEESRIFMFLDLKSSTTYAERLGHILYSELIQDCFYDLTDTIHKHNVEVYQYVGDEAVLTWKVEEGLKNANCLRAFFSFEKSIQRRADYYFNKYDLVPAFKAGVNIGLVMVAEVGVIKKEIAYHSDVLNTAARIQGCCNLYGKYLLISEFLHHHIGNHPDFLFEEIGKVQLKGKQQEVIIFSVDQKSIIEHAYEFSE